LAKGLVLEYLLPFHKEENNYQFHLITHEQKEFALSATETTAKKTELQYKNITWYPVKYRSGNFLLFKKAFNFLETLFITAGIKISHKPKAIMGFLSIPGAFSYILAKLFRLKLIIYCFEPHSEYMADFKIWDKNGLNYKLLHRFEQLQLKHADHIVVPNHHSEKLVESLKKQNSKLYVCPVCIDTDLMQFDADARMMIRTQLKIDNRTVIIYTGKFDGIYYSSDKVLAFFKKLYESNRQLFFYIITPNQEEVKASIEKLDFPDSAIHLSPVVSYKELHRFISAADIGFVALPPLPSQKYRTPVKTAIYLACGLPYLVNKGIAEDDIIAEKEKVGIVIQDLEETPEIICGKIRQLLSDNSTLHTRCRNFAEETRSINVAIEVIRNIFTSV
jgi:glycosyltransferase involved in cell wall biosynthesis